MAELMLCSSSDPQMVNLLFLFNLWVGEVREIWNGFLQSVIFFSKSFSYSFHFSQMCLYFIFLLIKFFFYIFYCKPFFLFTWSIVFKYFFKFFFVSLNSYIVQRLFLTILLIRYLWNFLIYLRRLFISNCESRCKS